MLNQRCCRYFDDHVVDTDLEIRIERVDALAHFCGAVHLDLGSEKEVWHWSKRRHQSLGNHFSNLTGRLVVVSRCCGWCLKTCGLDSSRIRRSSSSGRLRLADRSLDVSLDNATAWSTALQ